MRQLLAAVLAALSTASPAHAGPQWIDVSADGSIFANFNTVRGVGNLRSIDATIYLAEPTRARSSTMHVDCVAWRWAFTYLALTSSWSPIGRETVPETIAYLICPKQLTQSPAST